jgi:WD40 repeat protein
MARGDCTRVKEGVKDMPGAHFNRMHLWVVPIFVLVVMPLSGQPPADVPKPLLDAYGDPLPLGATARFGSVRWRMPGRITAVALSPDGKHLASTNGSYVAVWEAATGRELYTLAGHQPLTDCLAFSPDGQYLVTSGGEHPFSFDRGTGDNFVRVWDLSTGKQKAQFPKQWGRVCHVAFTLDGKALVSGGLDQPVMVWEFASGKKLREFPGSNGIAHPFALAPNGQWLAVADLTGSGKTVSLFHFAKGSKIGAFQLQEVPFYFEFSPDSRSLLIASGKQLLWWETSSGKVRQVMKLPESQPHEDLEILVLRLKVGRFFPDGKKVAYLDGTADIQWLDAWTAMPLSRWKGHRAKVSALAFSRDGRTGVSGGYDGAVRVWDAVTGKRIHAPEGPDGACHALAYAADGKTLLVGSADLHVLDAHGFQERQRIAGADTWTRALAFSPDRQLVAVVDRDGAAVLLEMPAGKALRTLQPAKWRIRSAAFGPGGKDLYAIGYEGHWPPSSRLRVWQVATGNEGPLLCKDLVQPNDLVISSTGQLIVAEGDQPRLRLWDLHSGKEEPSLNGRADWLLLSNDGKLLATMRNHSGLVVVWNLVKRLEEARLHVQPATVQGWSFHPNGKVLATGHDDGSYKTWNIADGKKLSEVKAHRGAVWALAFAPDGSALVSASDDGTVVKWHTTAWQAK